MAMKPRVLYLMQYLEQNSDEQHPVTTAQIRKELAAKGCPVSIITLRADIQSLLEAGYEISVTEKEGLSTTYSWIDRDLSAPELQILVDAVSSSQFITKEKSNDLIRKLVALAGPSYQSSLTHPDSGLGARESSEQTDSAQRTGDPPGHRPGSEDHL